MNKYKVTFDFDMDEVLDSDYHIEIESFDDNKLYDVFDEDGTQVLEDWYNSDNKDDIKIQSVQYEFDKEWSGEIIIVTDKEPKELQCLGDFSVEQLFELDCVYVTAHYEGTDYEPYWNYSRSEPDERKVRIDYSKDFSIYDYSNVQINKIN